MSSPARTILHVITGLVPVIPIIWSAAPHRIGMAGHEARPSRGRSQDEEGGLLQERMPLASDSGQEFSP
ncbi:hypothetical protein HPT29_017260 [Microvirga terrae]|uniref:Uncharacterized protein n=1 Tax=Microvirga terrae TaxID=2740529 RepID=A0ABY5RLY9_9HYPH|nr:hypothetical protein [Microvirga terrae]UVF18250.1 hypothetical protein HPT29_017260 [Microvirga terrae]